MFTGTVLAEVAGAAAVLGAVAVCGAAAADVVACASASPDGSRSVVATSATQAKLFPRRTIESWTATPMLGFACCLYSKLRLSW